MLFVVWHSKSGTFRLITLSFDFISNSLADKYSLLRFLMAFLQMENINEKITDF